MSNLTRWEPVREMMSLREAMDRLFDDAFTRPLSLSYGAYSVPAIDLYQTEDEVVVKAALPGFRPDDVQLSVENNVLTLRGEFKPQNGQNATYHIHEQRHGSFERSIPLPVDVETDKAQADFENGILTVTLPKAETVKPKTINIKAR